MVKEREMRKILIVNDDGIVSGLYRNKLESEGFKVQIINDGEKAIEALKIAPPDMVLLDLMLPKVDGLGVLKFIRSQLETHFTPVIALANSYSRELMDEAVHAGANRCIAKSNSNSKQIVEFVREFLTPVASFQPATHLADNVTMPMEYGAETSPTGGALSNTSAKPNKSSGFEADQQFQEEVQSHFLQRAPEMLEVLRNGLEKLANHALEGARTETLADFYSAAHLLCGHAGLAGFSQIAQLAGGMEALSKALHDTPEYFTASTLRTLAQATELLKRRVQQVKLEPVQPWPPIMILVVDDSVVDLMLIGDALEKVNLKGVEVGDPFTAYKLLEFNSFDLIFLDVEMPGINGFELCSKLRLIPAHKTTPVVFVTVHSDVQSIARSTISGGNDFIAKPFLDVELGVKALIHLNRTRYKVSAAELEKDLAYLNQV